MGCGSRGRRLWPVRAHGSVCAKRVRTCVVRKVMMSSPMVSCLPSSQELRFGTSPGRWTILATVLGSGIAALDGTVVGIALPAIGRQFRADVSSLQWIVTGYTLSLAGLLLLGGALGDRFGRRRLFVIGVVWFAAASLLCGVAPPRGSWSGRGSYRASAGRF